MDSGERERKLGRVIETASERKKRWAGRGEKTRWQEAVRGEKAR